MKISIVLICVKGMYNLKNPSIHTEILKEEQSI